MDDEFHDFLITVLVWAVAFLAAAAVCNAEPHELAIVKPVRECCAGMPPTLADVLCRLPEADARRARFDDDQITWAHEGTHFLHSRLSRPGHRAFYVGAGDAWEFPIPKRTRLSHVAAAVPEKHRGHVYRLYLVDGRQWWDDVALYPYDEALAYWAGAMVRREIGNPKRQETERYAVELTVYARYALQEIVKREDDSYPKEELAAFFDLMVARGRLIVPAFDAQPHAEALSNYGRDLVRLAERDDAAE
jgi:hypothetical protein